MSCRCNKVPRRLPYAKLNVADISNMFFENLPMFFLFLNDQHIPAPSAPYSGHISRGDGFSMFLSWSYRCLPCSETVHCHNCLGTGGSDGSAFGQNRQGSIDFVMSTMGQMYQMWGSVWFCDHHSIISIGISDGAIQSRMQKRHEVL